MLQRCPWVNLKNPEYVKYHDEEWSRPKHKDQELYELLILESFQAGLSWECVLNKREAFRKAYDNFEIEKIVAYDDKKIDELLKNPAIIRNKLKVKASIRNSLIFQNIQKEFGSFDNYIWGFSNHKIITEDCMSHTTSPLSDIISKDLKKRGMTFVGSTIIYSYLQAIGMIDAHHCGCFLHNTASSPSK